MKIIIAGAGDVGFHLAKLLSYESQDTYIIDFDGEKLEYLNSHLDVITKSFPEIAAIFFIRTL